MPALSIRWQVARKLVELMKAHDDARKVQIELGYPGDLELAGLGGVSEAMWVDAIQSSQEIPVMSGARMHRDDEFTIAWLIRVAGHPSLDLTMARIEALAQIADDVCADDAHLGDVAGLLSAEVVAADMTCGRTPDAFLGYGTFEVRCHARLT